MFEDWATRWRGTPRQTLPPLIDVATHRRSWSYEPTELRVGYLRPPSRWLQIAPIDFGRRLPLVLAWFGVPLAISALIADVPWALSLATFLLAMAMVVRDVAQVRGGCFTCGTSYALLAGSPALANMIAIFAADTPQRDRYFLFVSEPHVSLAAQLALANALLPPLGVWLVYRWRPARQWAEALVPPVLGRTADRATVAIAGWVGFLAVLGHGMSSELFTSTFTSLFYLLPCFAVFVLCKAAAERPIRYAFLVAGALAFTESIRAFLFSYLRSTIALPYFAFAIGSFLGARSPRTLFSTRMLPIYAAVVIYGANYGLLGMTREYAPSGIAKIAYMSEYDAGMSDEQRSTSETLLSRLSNINQLSQIGRIVDEDGFYHGGTFGYIVYAFIPRFLWKEKPLIDRGTWFALRIGQAQPGEIWPTNTVNMTQGGELYLNFGWIGLVFGLVAYGMFLGVLWIAARFYEPNNHIGTAFGYYLIWSTLGQNGDFTIVVTSIAVYLVFLALSTGITFAMRTRSGLGPTHYESLHFAARAPCRSSSPSTPDAIRRPTARARPHP